jgi:hypothetical protein
MTPPNWAALFSDNYPLRGVFRLDSRHNQAESSQQVMCDYHKPGACA